VRKSSPFRTGRANSSNAGRKCSYAVRDGARQKDLEESDAGSLTIEIGDDDRGLVEGMRSNLINTRSKDGIAVHLFPLTSKSQSDYVFHLIGREHVRGRDVLHMEVFARKRRTNTAGKGTPISMPAPTNRWL
jgi:hypothetical protein